MTCESRLLESDPYQTDEVFKVTLALVKRSYSDQDVKKVLGGNRIRLFENVAEVAKLSAN